MRSVVAFFALAFAITWGAQLPGALAAVGILPGPVERYLPLMGLGAFGPALAAWRCARAEGGREGGRALLRPLRAWRVGAGWYVFALAHSGAAFVAGMAVYEAVTGRDVGPWFYVPHEAATLTAALVFSLGEEIGWRGYALPRLQRVVGPLAASALIGAAWCAWHALMFVASGSSLGLLASLLPFFVAGSVVYTWIYNRTGGSLLLVVLAHIGAHLNNSNKPLPANVTPVMVHSAAYVALTAAVVLLDRRAWRREGSGRG